MDSSRRRPHVRLAWLFAWLTVGFASIAGIGIPAAAEPAKPSADRFDIVVIDAGHGGDDDGAIGPAGNREKDVVLAVARELAKRLRSRDVQVVMTRVDDVFVSLEQRTAIANDARGDLFLSIHANADADAASHGTETYFLALEASDAAAAGVASRENRSFEGDAQSQIEALNDPFIALLGDLIATEHHEESSQLASAACRSRSRRRRCAPAASNRRLFVVLTGVQMPAALVEIGFVTNPRR